ncbi:Uncharacterised protein [Vibrio cholerae]|nr:Uncharacterised protein [Vibrio cholerae]
MKSHSRPSEDRPNFSNAERHKEPLHQMACLGNVKKGALPLE